MRRPLLVLPLLVVGVLFAQPPAAAAPKKYAVLVGVNKYAAADKLPALNYAVADAVDMATVLGKAGYRVDLLTDDTAIKPTKANIEAAVRKALRAAVPGDTVLVALAGHGLKFEEQADAFFCPPEARPFKDETKTLVSLTELYVELDKSHAGAKVLLVDACRNEPKKGPGERSGVDGAKAPRPPDGIVALFSCSDGEKAFEPEAYKHGAFFHFVLEGLKGSAKNGDGEVTFNSLADFVTKRVSIEVPKLAGGHPQTPKQQANIRGGSPVLVRFDGEVPPPPPMPGTAPALLKAPFSEAEAKAAQAAWAKHIGKKVVEEFALGNGVSLEMVLIPPGTYRRGTTDGELARLLTLVKDSKKEWFENEMPASEITITKPFYMAKYAVTQEQYTAVTGKANPSYFAASGDGKARVAGMDTAKFPVEQVSWDDAVAFCDALKAKGKFVLPTEAEWEYACRAGTTTFFHFGDVLNGDKANVDGEYPFGTETKGEYKKRTCKVGSYDANGFGLYDMHGNVWQWCRDFYGPYSALTDRSNPFQSIKQSDNFRVLRGGSWYDDALVGRAATATGARPMLGTYTIGFRLCLPWSS